MVNKAIPGPYREVRMEAGPHGGAYSVTYYFNSKYKPVVKEEATRSITHEYDEKSRSIFRTNGGRDWKGPADKGAEE